MSSAALQPAAIASALSPPPLIPDSPSAHHYASSSHSSPTRAEYHANQQNAVTSPPSSQRPSSKSSRNGAVPHSPAPPSQSNSPMSSRAAISSPVAVPASSTPEYHTSSSDRRRHAPPVAPPRTSSNRHEQGNSGSGSGSGSGSRRTAQGDDRATDSPRRRTESQSAPDGLDAQGENTATQSSRRKVHHNSRQEPPPERTSSNNHDSRFMGPPTTNMPTRHHSTAASSKSPSREASEILNTMLITREEVDIEREKERLALAQPHHIDALDDGDDAATPPDVPIAGHGEENRRGGRSRHDHSKREKHTKFGEYILGNTIGEGEFGKVKLGWKQEGGVQVAIKLIKKDSLGNNPARLAKIMREVAILKQLRHPNIVQLHKMEESERHYGIVLEYASGGELFDYILNHRYLKDGAARRLFAQLISGVGYLHKKGIVHRDLKLENLLLDRNRNIIITDFGFANTFDPLDELSDEEEANLSDRDFVKRVGLDRVKPNGSRKGDLMQTSCGSPCYAAPELVVSDSLYTGRKVDVWSCGVILYAMLAGYLPFDDDPANPEGDNINLLYKYIVNTPLTFPEYVTPHARDLLRRILVPNPRKRADLFEVARHSWLSEYAHVVEFITSSTTSPSDIQNIPVDAEEMAEGAMLGRSASVRESSKKAGGASATIGGLASKPAKIDAEAEAAIIKQQKDNKRRTVQVEYVAPTTQTQRGDAPPSAGKTRARSSSQGPVEVTSSPASPRDKPLPQDPPVSKDAYGKPARESRRPPSAHRNQNLLPARSSREARAVSDNAYMTAMPSSVGGPRPPTGGSMASTGSRGLGAGSRASYGQPLPPAVAGTNVHGRIQQPKSGAAKNYVISNPIPQDPQNADFGRPSAGVPPKFARVSGFASDNGSGGSVSVGGGGEAGEAKGHRRSNTLGEISGKLFGRSGSLFGGKSRRKPEQQEQQQPQQQAQQQTGEKPKRYPPVSMSNAMPGGEEPRTSMDSKRSRRSFSMGLGKKRSGSIEGSQTSQERHTRRFSLLPASFSLKAIGIGKDYSQDQDSQTELPIQEPPQSASAQQGRYVDSRGAATSNGNTSGGYDVAYTQALDPQQMPASAGGPASSSPMQARFAPGQYERRPSGVPGYIQQGPVLGTGSDSSVDNMQQQQRMPPRSAPYQGGEYENSQGQEHRRVASRGNRGVLQKNKRLVDAYDTDNDARPHDHSGSSGAARRVMDFFRRRGKARGGEDR